MDYTIYNRKLPKDYTFCTNQNCGIKDCLRKNYPKDENLSFAFFESEWDESLKKYACENQIKAQDV
jgi:hypothetical protein